MNDLTKENTIRISIPSAVRNTLIVTTMVAMGIVLLAAPSWTEAFGILLISGGIGTAVGLMIHHDEY